MKTFLEALDNRVLVCDGAMGTMLYSRGIFTNKSFDAMNLGQPQLVEDVHQEYVRAGADILETNTFGANRIKLGSFGLADKLGAINAAGVWYQLGANVPPSAATRHGPTTCGPPLVR